MPLPRPLPWKLIAVGVLLLAFVVERVIVTDAEAIEALTDDIEAAANERDWDTLLGLLSPDFEYAGKDREGTIALLQRHSERFKPGGATFGIYKLEVDGDRAKARGRINVRMGNGHVPLAGDVIFARTPDGWALHGAEAFYVSLN